MTPNPITPPAELVREWIKEYDDPEHPRWEDYEMDIAARAAQWGADRARTALAEGAGVGVTDEEAIARIVYERALRASAFEEVQRFWPRWEDLPDSQARDCAFNAARAVLASYATTHPRPIPVAERLPTAADCDSDGCCWIWDWLAECWRMGPVSWLENTPAEDAYDWWLPAAAIPLPEVDA